MMDDEPFLTVDFGKGAKTQISDTVVEGIYAMTKGHFNPETVSENARRNITHRTFFEYLADQFKDPSIEFTRFLLKVNEIKHVRQNAIDGYQSIAKAAFYDVFTSNVLKRLDISPPTPVQRAEAPSQEPTTSVEISPPEKGIVTTDAELRAFE